MSLHTILRDISNTRHVSKIPVTNPFCLGTPLSNAKPQPALKPLNLFKSLINPVRAPLYGKTNQPEKEARPKIARKPSAPFARALAHEIRNPLSNIGMAVDMLRSPSSPEDQQLYLDIIMRGSVRINDLVTGLLTATYVGDQRSERFPVDQLLDEALARTRDRLTMKNVLVTREYTAQGYKILANKERMKIALTNILINAIDAMPSADAKLTLVTRCVDGICSVEIRDNGMGIGKEDLEKIFTPYFTTKPNGLGLGLSTTLDILRSNKVKVIVESEKGLGTNFILSFDEVRETMN